MLVKALKAAVDSNNFEQSMILQAEIAYVQYVPRPRHFVRALTPPAQLDARQSRRTHAARMYVPSLPPPATHALTHARARIADRYKKMVYDFLANHCGRQFVAPLPETSYRQARYPSPPDSAYDGGAAYANGLYTAYGAPAAGAAQGRRGSL